MAKSIKVRYDGVAVYSNGWLMSRVQNVSTDTDLGEEEAKELTNEEVVEYSSTNPQVSVSIETNEYGSVRNLFVVAGITGAGQTLGAAGHWLKPTHFDGSTADISIAVEEDSVLKRTLVINDAYLSSISWNFDVGGVATESFSFEADNKEWLANAYKQAFAIMAVSGSIDDTGKVIGLFPVPATGYSAYKLFANGVSVSIIGSSSGAYGGHTFLYVSGSDTGLASTPGASGSCLNISGVRTSTMPRIKAFFYKDSPDTTIQQVTSKATNPIGSIPRGKINIVLASGGEAATITGLVAATSTNLLRLQSVSIDVDFGREVLNELGHYRAYDRSLTYPIPVNVTFSALASDIEEWAKFSGASTTANAYSITNFSKTNALRIAIFDKQDTDSTRRVLKDIIITGLQITSESFGVDVGGNATQDFTGKSSNFSITGLGTPGVFPLAAAPID